MSLAWTDWITPPKVEPRFPGSPYVNWWIARRPLSTNADLAGDDKLEMPLEDAQKRIAVEPPQFQFIHKHGEDDGHEDLDFRASPGEKYQAEYPIQNVPIRKKAINADLWKQVAKNPKTKLQDAPDFNKIPKLTRDCVIVGVVDRGVPLNNSRLLGVNSTRILAAWQMDANWDHSSQKYLPFGREVYQHDINYALKHTQTDEDFNDVVGLVDLTSLNRVRDITYRQSHGAAVLDLAAGAAKGVAPENIWVIVVNLPGRETIGLSGAFLDFFTALACERIKLLADWYWAHSVEAKVSTNTPPDAHKDAVEREVEKPEAAKRQGFPVVMNLSFGKNAGPQRSDGFFHRTIADIRAARPPGAPFVPVIPVGNDNLEEGHAKRTIPAFDGANAEASKITQGWWVQPEDQSPSFLEIWSEPIEDELLDDKGKRYPFTLDVFAPGQAIPLVGRQVPKVDSFRVFNEGASPPNGTAAMLGNAPYAAVFVRRFSEPGGGSFSRLQFTLCVLPTLDQLRPNDVVPSGEWQIVISNETSRHVDFDFMVQTDQSDSRSTRTSQRSWLTDSAYERYDETGRAADSYAYPRLSAIGQDMAQVQRHGTVNSTAVGDGFLAITGHRELDGRPVSYSSTGQRNGSNQHVPDVSCPIEDGAAHAGILSAGARDGTCIPIGGTSMASAIVTRAVSLELANMLKGGASVKDVEDFDPELWLRLVAQKDDPFDVSTFARAKLGWGRMKHQGHQRPQRFYATRDAWPDPNASLE